MIQIESQVLHQGLQNILCVTLSLFRHELPVDKLVAVSQRSAILLQCRLIT